MEDMTDIKVLSFFIVHIFLPIERISKKTKMH